MHTWLAKSPRTSFERIQKRFSEKSVAHRRNLYFFGLSPHVRESGLRNPRNFCSRNPQSEKFVLVGSELLGFGIRNPGQGIRNPANDWSPESKFH